MIVTNNDKVYSELKSEYNIYYEDCSFREILIYIRDRVHEGYSLLTHPLSSSIKPNETPYKSVIISDKKNKLDNDSLLIIENAILSFDKFARDANHTIQLTDRICDDFKTVDLSIIKSSLR